MQTKDTIKDKEKGLNRCVCLDVNRDQNYGDVQITYALFKDDEELHDMGFRQKYDCNNIDLYFK